MDKYICISFRRTTILAIICIAVCVFPVQAEDQVDEVKSQRSHEMDQSLTGRNRRQLNRAPTQQYDPSECLRGFYGEECSPCHSSCRTCSNGDSCDTCEDFMYLDKDSLLCRTCYQDYFYDDTTEQCTSCEGSCNNECAHRDECLQCGDSLILDIDTFECVSECASGKIEVISSQFITNKICKTQSIYVDPESSKAIELGTLEYPYRTMLAAGSEILHHYSHSDSNITVYTKDCYLQTDHFYIINMTSVNFINHPDLPGNKMASIVVSNHEQECISLKARVHLLAHCNTDPSEEISAGTFTESEFFDFSSSNVCFHLSRSDLKMENVEVYADNVDDCIRASFVQEKTIWLSKDQV
ncbi:unnamed protein product [Moneuplotes crassus]|uniref:Uncharacterized protein n=1 Tax=Euplotes crassus TaxID=5936 RepID=A0AAD1X830_EUPCR|nr:unnamed protein product [Moneuplotes crassus]